MLKSILFKQDFRCFPAGQRFEFRPGINLLVGDQGSGKTTILVAIGYEPHGNFEGQVKLEVEGRLPLFSYDAEKDNPRTLSRLAGDGFDGFVLAARFQSHGETMNQILASFVPMVASERKKHPKYEPVVLLDEPDLGLSIRSCYKLLGLMHSLKDLGAQVLCAAHNPVVIEHFDEVLDVETRLWRPSREFVLDQKGAWALSSKSSEQL